MGKVGFRHLRVSACICGYSGVMIHFLSGGKKNMENIVDDIKMLMILALVLYAGTMLLITLLKHPTITQSGFNRGDCREKLRMLRG